MRVGRTRRKLAALLTTELGVPVNPTEIWQNVGRNAEGGVRWGVWVEIDNRNINACSFDTMSECLKKGIGWRYTCGGGVIEICVEDSPQVIKL